MQTPAKPFGDSRARHALLVEQRLVAVEPLRGDPGAVGQLERDVLPPRRDAEAELDVVQRGAGRGIEGDDGSMAPRRSLARGILGEPMAICSAS